MRPVVSAWAERLYANLSPYTDQDAGLGYPLLRFCGSLGDNLFQEVDDYARDNNGVPGWAGLFNPNLCPPQVLPWLGQLVGVAVDTTLSVDNQRAQVIGVQGWARGTPASIIAAVQLYLTGTKYVVLQERLGGNAYALGIQTHSSETPILVDAMMAAIRKVLPAGMLLTMNTYVGQTFGQMLSTAPTFASVKTHWSTFDAVRHG